MCVPCILLWIVFSANETQAEGWGNMTSRAHQLTGSEGRLCPCCPPESEWGPPRDEISAHMAGADLLYEL